MSAGKADELECFDDNTIDVLFTDALLLYIRPDKIKKVIREMERIARKALVYNEWHCEDKEFLWHDGHWIYNYRVVLSEYFSTDNIKISKLEKDLWAGLELFVTIIQVRL